MFNVLILNHQYFISMMMTTENRQGPSRAHGAPFDPSVPVPPRKKECVSSFFFLGERDIQSTHSRIDVCCLLLVVGQWSVVSGCRYTNYIFNKILFCPYPPFPTSFVLVSGSHIAAAVVTF
jgi:hypothetical protein